MSRLLRRSGLWAKAARKVKENMGNNYFETNYASPIGALTLASEGERLVGLWLEGQKYFGGSMPGKMIHKDDLPVFSSAKNWLDRYFAGRQPDPSELPLAPIGGEFRQEVWKILLQIPYGQVITYGEISQRLGMNCAQAVGGAVGHNPISIIIPCHRVVGSDGKLTGYAGGVDKKAWLLEHEGINVTALKKR